MDWTSLSRAAFTPELYPWPYLDVAQRSSVWELLQSSHPSPLTPHLHSGSVKMMCWLFQRKKIKEGIRPRWCVTLLSEILIWLAGPHLHLDLQQISGAVYSPRFSNAQNHPVPKKPFITGLQAHHMISVVMKSFWESGADSPKGHHCPLLDTLQDPCSLPTGQTSTPQEHMQGSVWTSASTHPRNTSLKIHPAHCAQLHLSVDYQLPDKQEAAAEVGENHIQHLDSQHWCPQGCISPQYTGDLSVNLLKFEDDRTVTVL